MGKIDLTCTVCSLFVVSAVLLFFLVQETLQGHEQNLPPLAVAFARILFLILAMVWYIVEDFKNNLR